jgi:leucyl-tRNA synthetase
MAYRWHAVVDREGALVRAPDGDDPRVVANQDGGLLFSETGDTVTVRWLKESEIRITDGRPIHPEHGVRVIPVAEKMSKARGNVVNPDDMVREFGADSLRIYEMFMGPLEQVKPWQTTGIQGVRRFLDRVFALAHRDLDPGPMGEETSRLVHRTVKKVGEDIEAMRFNTAISAMMILTNHLQSMGKPPREALELLVLCLAPFAPHLGEELWAALGHPPSVSEVPWPDYDTRWCVDEVVELGVQVNGRVRGRITLPKDAPEKAAVEAALTDENVQKFAGGRELRKVVYVPGRILNLIVG